MKLLNVESIESARHKLLRNCSKKVKTEMVALRNACGRILAGDIRSPVDVPAFRRSTVDGYAVAAKDTAAASESMPVLLSIKGQVLMGETAGMAMKSGECVQVPTGGMVPEGADAVAMIEYCETFGDGVAIGQSVANGAHVVKIGEDMRKDAAVLSRGRRLLPQDVGVLAALGITEVPAFKPVRMTIISTGDELVAPETDPGLGQIRDINTYALAALAEKNGYEVIGTIVLPDDDKALENAVRASVKQSGAVVISGGSSKGTRDFTRDVIDRVADPGVYLHGIAVKPGKPTILGCDLDSGTILAGLPGHPVSAMMVFELLFGWLSRELMGMPPPIPIPARIDRNVAASPGSLTSYPVKLAWENGEVTATPVIGKSGLITTLSKADGYFSIDRNREGLPEGEIVKVYLF